jgi:CRP-like cAMP-binding protein
MHRNEIRAIPLYRSVPRSRRAEAARVTDRITFPAGGVVIRQGDLAHEFFVILEGVADVIRDGRLVATLGSGDFFGEIALVGPPFRTATVVARSELDLAVVARREFRTLLRRFPHLASTVLSAGRTRVVSTLREVEARS